MNIFTNTERRRRKSKSWLEMMKNKKKKLFFSWLNFKLNDLKKFKNKFIYNIKRRERNVMKRINSEYKD